MLCDSHEVIDDSKCPCKTCLLRNVYSDELEDYLRERGKLKKDEERGVEDSPESENKNLRNTKIVLLVVNSDGTEKPQRTGAQQYNKSNRNVFENKGRGNLNDMGMMRLDATAATPTCELCDRQYPDLKKSPTMVRTYGHSETLSACKQIDQSKNSSNFGCNHEGAFKSECRAEADFCDHCKKEKCCGRQHPILIKRPVCKEKQRMGKVGICDPLGESDEDDYSPNTCWCDMQRLEHTFSRIVPNEDCMCYCKKGPEPPKKKKKKPQKKMYSRYWKLDPVILCPRPCYLENPCRCREWCGYHPCWPDPRSVYRCDYMPYC